MTLSGKWLLAGLSLLLGLETANAAPRQHSITLGPPRTVSIVNQSGKAIPLKIRRLVVDDKFKESTVGPFHDVTDRIFVVRKASQLNDSLPQDTNKAPRWVWRMEGWITVDRQTGHISQINLPMFDQETSDVSWYRDLAAYCGSSDDHSKTYLMVFQIGRRKPLLKKEFTGEPCSAPAWERQPTRVTFLNGSARSSFAVTARGADLQTPTKDDDEDESE
jgi:hypothetical protein